MDVGNPCKDIVNKLITCPSCVKEGEVPDLEGQCGRCPHNSVQAGMFVDRCRDCGEFV